jgi:hypothetical protein
MLPRHIIWLTLAALASLAGSVAILAGIGAVTATGTGLPGTGVNALGVYFLVIALALGGLVLAAMAWQELLDFRRQLRLR